MKSQIQFREILQRRKTLTESREGFIRGKNLTLGSSEDFKCQFSEILESSKNFEDASPGCLLILLCLSFFVTVHSLVDLKSEMFDCVEGFEAADQSEDGR